ncbi:unnamed protein product [Pedinophyceae sp. YPF-701]|nr:unnamed protein product [Pedinophyceae sp. YPF-701]
MHAHLSRSAAPLLAGRLDSRRLTARRSRATAVVRAESKSSQAPPRQKWDFQRFLKTALFFNPPSAGGIARAVTAPIRILGKLAGVAGDEEQPAPLLRVRGPGSVQPISAVTEDQMLGKGAVLVTGATGGVGKRVVEILLSRGERVRAVVRSTEKGEKLLAPLASAHPNGTLEMVAADLSQEMTLLPELFTGVRAVVSCAAAKVRPKEEVPDSAEADAKYYQGIKFYDPRVVGDTPEAIEFRGVANLARIASEHVPLPGGRVLLDPAKGAAGNPEWGALDDVVMGGASSSTLRLADAGGEDGGPVALFSGNVTSANNGGFTSVRTRNFDPPLDLGAYEGIRLRVKGNGMRYKLILRCDGGWDSLAYCRSFDTPPGEWTDVNIPFAEFKATFRSKTVKDGKPPDASRIFSIQLMLSKFEYDGKLNPSFREGPYELPVASIAAYPPERANAADRPCVVHVSSAGVTRPDRPGIDVEVEPPAVKMNAMLGGLLTYKLRGEDALRTSGVPYAIVRPTALTEEPGGMPLVFEQGDTIKGKISRQDVAELCCALLDTNGAAGLTFEVSSTVPFSEAWEGAGGATQMDRAAEVAAAGLRRNVTGRTVAGRYTGTEVDPEL